MEIHSGKLYNKRWIIFCFVVRKVFLENHENRFFVCINELKWKGSLIIILSNTKMKIMQIVI